MLEAPAILCPRLGLPEASIRLRRGNVTDLKSTLERLYALGPRRAQLGLSRVEAACAKFGNPERAFQVVHVAGTNGKGSVAAFVASMLRATGKHVGLYTSPHLNRFAERFVLRFQVNKWDSFHE